MHCHSSYPQPFITHLALRLTHTHTRCYCFSFINAGFLLLSTDRSITVGLGSEYLAPRLLGLPFKIELCKVLFMKQKL